ncbi:hypothetical protein ES703_115444 [subsurface metagenome]
MNSLSPISIDSTNCLNFSSIISSLLISVSSLSSGISSTGVSLETSSSSATVSTVSSTSFSLSFLQPLVTMPNIKNRIIKNIINR